MFGKIAHQLFQFLSNELEGKINFKLSNNSLHENKQYTEGLIFCTSHDFSIESGISFLNSLRKVYPSPDRFLANIEKLKIEEILKMFQEIIDFQFNEMKNCLDEEEIIAIDFNDVEFYGKENKMIVRSKLKNGTDKFYRFATAKIAKNEFGLTLAILPVSQFDTKEKILLKLIEEVRKKLKIKLLLIDRGFYSVKIVNLLNSLGINFLMPIPKNQGIKNFIVKMLNLGERIAEYEMKSGKNKAKINVILSENGKKSYSLHENFHIFATNVEDLEVVVYGKRWSIETSYRVKDDFMIRTTSVDYRVRLFIYLLSIIFMNFWLIFNLLNKGEHIPTIYFRVFILFEVFILVALNCKVAYFMKEVGHA